MTSSSSNMTSIEEIVKYQQELLNYQRNQKQIQKETIKLLNSLNTSLTMMSERLDEFALKTNIKLDDYVPANNNNSNLISTPKTNQQSQINLVNNVNNVNTNALTPTNGTNIKYLLNNNEIIYLSGDLLTSTPPPQAPIVNQNLNSKFINNGNINNNNHNISSNNNNKNDLFILNDFNTNMISIDQLTAANAAQANKIYLINNNGNNINSTLAGGNMLLNPISLNPTGTVANLTALNGNGISGGATVLELNKATTKQLLDTTNTKEAHKLVNNSSSMHNHTNTSDESISGEMSYDESSDDEKETIQSKKKPRRSSKDGSGSKGKDTEEGNSQQRLFNKFVRESVEKRLGKEFLLMHEIQEINHDIMEEIKKEALDAYPPVSIRPRRAWHLAKASLRCRRRSLRRQKEKLTSTTTTTTTTTNATTNGPNGTSTSASSSTSIVSSLSTTPVLTPNSTANTNAATAVNLIKQDNKSLLDSHVSYSLI